ncbi:MAG TPA: PAS domain S-box protein [Chthoniobacter sp.]
MHSLRFLLITNGMHLSAAEDPDPDTNASAAESWWLREQLEAVTRQLAQSEQRYKSLFEHQPDGVYTIDRDGRFLSFNPAGESLSGFSADELLFLPWQRLLAPEDLARGEQDFQRALQGEVVRAECAFIRGDGKRCRMKVTSLPTVIDGEVVGVVWIARDVTQRRQADELVREHAALLDNAQEAIYVQDLAGVITFWNRSAERTYGFPSGEMTGSSLQPHTSTDLKSHQAAWRQVLGKGDWMGELMERTAAGKEIVMECHWTLVSDAAGEPQSILCINSDITEKKKLEAQFLRAQRMESIGTLAGGIAHDLNNVLSPIIMAVDLLKMKNTDAATGDVLDTLEAIARRGADMVQQVLSFARGVEGERIIVQPKHLVKEIQKIVADTFPKNIELKLAVQPDLWSVLGDPTQLHQVLLNLCVNARDALPEGGRITVSAENVTLDEEFAAMHLEANSGPHLVLAVEDNGSGMPAGMIEKIFDPFFTTKELGKGTGLGLSTSLAIVKSHKGFIQVHSELGRGSSFRVHLPAQIEGAAVEDNTIRSFLPRGQGEWILVVDDEISVRTVMQQTLEAFGYRVVVACDGVDAVSVYAQRSAEISIVITDLMMPIMDGPALIQVLAKINPLVKIITTSGLTGQYPAARGSLPNLSKPYTTEVLLQKLATVLAG